MNGCAFTFTLLVLFLVYEDELELGFSRGCRLRFGDEFEAVVFVPF
jgi:hypothetical protein